MCDTLVTVGKNVKHFPHYEKKQEEGAE